MYRVLKTKGNNANVVVENTDTKANVIIGRLSTEILKILETAGYKTEDDTLKLTDEWNLSVDRATASELSKMAMKMKKPIRDQRKEEAPKKSNKEIDAMDVLLGLATYN